VTNIEAGQRAANCVDEAEVVELLQRLVAVPSVTGNETEVARLCAAELAASDCDEASTFEFASGRENAYGLMKGTGGGPSLMLLGHLDTVHVEGWSQRWAGTPHESPFAGAIEAGELYGRGAADQKAGIAMSIAAARAIRRAGLRTKGDLQFGFVGDEEGGEEGCGFSDGVKALVTRLATGEIPTPDFAIYTEPTQLRVEVAQIGFFIADITITGQSVYFARPWLGADALRAATDVLEALYAYSDDLMARPEHPLLGKNLLVMTGIKGGGYVAVVGDCTITLIRTLMPTETLDEARAELEARVNAVALPDGARVDFDYTSPRDHPVGGAPSEVARDHPAVQGLCDAVERELDKPATISGFTAWSEIPFLADGLGVPGVYFAPGDISTCHTTEEHVNVAELVAATRTLARFIAGYCEAAD
jgi:acetylornithine deacetylase